MRRTRKSPAPVGQGWHELPLPNAHLDDAGSEAFEHAPVVGSVKSPESEHATA